jgi:hypothetical protein
MSFQEPFPLGDEYNEYAAATQAAGSGPVVLGIEDPSNVDAPAIQAPIRSGKKAGVSAINTKIGRIRANSSPYSPTSYIKMPHSAGGSGLPSEVTCPFSPVDGSEFDHSQLPIFTAASPVIYSALPTSGNSGSFEVGNTTHIDDCIKEYLVQQQQAMTHQGNGLSTPPLMPTPPMDVQKHPQPQVYHHQPPGPTRYIVQHPHHHLGQQPGMTSYNHHLEFFLCPEPGCGKSFLKQYNLNSHAKVHSTEKPHKCTSCPLAFKRKHDLGMWLGCLIGSSTREACA